METFRKQATKLREQVSKQQQTVLKQFGGGCNSDNGFTDEALQKLEKLHLSTRAAKQFQRDIARGIEGYIVTGSKQVEFGTKLSVDARKYGTENTSTSGSILSKAALSFSKARAQMEKERGKLLKALGTQVTDPLRAMVMGAPLEDARHLAQRYDRLRQEAEAQAIELSKRQSKVRETSGNPEILMKLEAAELKLQDMKSNVGILGREASSAMAAVEAQQQRQTLQIFISMVEAERAYHQRALQILEQLKGEMISERQQMEDAPSPTHNVPQNGATGSMDYFLGEVTCPYQAESDIELSLSMGDYVVIRKVSSNGWAEGECRGRAGWFPFAYAERRERVLASQITAVF